MKYAITMQTNKTMAIQMIYNNPLVFSHPPWQAITIFCLLSTSYILGVAYPPAGSLCLHSYSPESLSNALMRSSFDAAININPPEAVTGPP